MKFQDEENIFLCRWRTQPTKTPPANVWKPILKRFSHTNAIFNGNAWMLEKTGWTFLRNITLIVVYGELVLCHASRYVSYVYIFKPLAFIRRRMIVTTSLTKHRNQLNLLVLNLIDFCCGKSEFILANYAHVIHLWNSENLICLLHQALLWVYYSFQIQAKIASFILFPLSRIYYFKVKISFKMHVPVKRYVPKNDAF